MKSEQIKINLAVIGCGGFSKRFIPLFSVHPYVERVYVCDTMRERAERYAKEFGVEIVDSFEDALQSREINAVAIFTPRHTHGDLVVRALDAGKHVYSAVPMGVSVEECGRIIDAVVRSGKVYMMGETCIYYPSSMYCKEAYERGDFGKFVYAEAHYHHDLSHFSEIFIKDRPASAVPPLFYATHSTAMVLHAVDAYVTKVSAMGYDDTEENTPFAEGENYWDNTFSNEFALMRLSNGGIARISECRRIGFKAPSSAISAFYGTQGSYQFSNAQHVQTHLTPKGVTLQDVSETANPVEMTKNNDGSVEFKEKVANHGYQNGGYAPTQEERASRLPDSFKAMNGQTLHMGTHLFLVDDFCECVAKNEMPYVNAWRAARYTIPGLIAHESAKLGGVPLDVPDFGDAPQKV